MVAHQNDKKPADITNREAIEAEELHEALRSDRLAFKFLHPFDGMKWIIDRLNLPLITKHPWLDCKFTAKEDGFDLSVRVKKPEDKT